MHAKDFSSVGAPLRRETCSEKRAAMTQRSMRQSPGKRAVGSSATAGGGVAANAGFRQALLRTTDSRAFFQPLRRAGASWSALLRLVPGGSSLLHPRLKKMRHDDLLGATNILGNRGTRRTSIAGFQRGENLTVRVIIALDGDAAVNVAAHDVAELGADPQPENSRSDATARHVLQRRKRDDGIRG